MIRLRPPQPHLSQPTIHARRLTPRRDSALSNPFHRRIPATPAVLPGSLNRREHSGIARGHDSRIQKLKNTKLRTNWTIRIVHFCSTFIPLFVRKKLAFAATHGDTVIVASAEDPGHEVAPVGEPKEPLALYTILKSVNVPNGVSPVAVLRLI